MTTALIVLAALFTLIYGGLAVVAIRRPLLARLASREALRRPTQSALLIVGLMIAGASILTALILADSAEDSQTASIMRDWGRVDLLVTSHGQGFSRDVATSVAADPTVQDGAAGVQAGLELVTSVADLDRQLTQSAVRLIGFDPGAQQPFSAYTLTDGRRTYGLDVATGSVLLSQSLADALDAKAGDRLQLTIPGDRTSQPVTVTVAGSRPRAVRAVMAWCRASSPRLPRPRR